MIIGMKRCSSGSQRLTAAEAVPLGSASKLRVPEDNSCRGPPTPRYKSFSMVIICEALRSG